MVRSTLINSSLLALALLASGPAAAEESPGARAAVAAVNTVGHWIADQGNQTLREIRKDLRKSLVATLKPLLPAPAVVAPSAVATADAR